MNETITAIPGLRFGVAENRGARTGCAVLICERGTTAAAAVRGGAPGTRELAALRPGNLVKKAHAVLLTGGSAFGLDAAGGVMAYLEERGVGFQAGSVRVPIVPAAALFDLGVGDSRVRPDATMGRAACENASSAPVQAGLVGPGIGATVGKALGMTPSNGGLGSALKRGPSGLLVGAVVAVNAVGNVVDPSTGGIVAGARDPETNELTPFEMTNGFIERGGAGLNTTIGVVASNADLSQGETHRMASMAHDGLARTIRPAHTLYDGDTLFALALGGAGADANAAGTLAAEAVAEAVLAAVRPAS